MSKKNARPRGRPRTKKIYLPSKDGLLDLATDKLLSSGLTLTDAENMGITFLSADETAALHPSFQRAPCLRFDYFGLDGKPLSPRPKWPAFYRIRYLSNENSFDVLASEKPRRYTQEPGSGVCAYLPRTIDWTTVAANVEESIIITEGELKAAKACREGFITIGLGGVYNFRSSKLGVSFLPELETFQWVRRKVFVCYDSDFVRKPEVCAAINTIAQELMDRGALVHLVSLPDVAGYSKTGLDDFLVDDESGEGLVEMLRAAPTMTLVEPLFQLNEKVIYVRDPGLVVERESRMKMAPGAFKEHAFSTLSCAERIVKDDGSLSMKRASASAVWLKWPLRSEAGRMEYLPGQEALVKVPGEALPILNVWEGWGCKAVKGDATPFLKLVDHLFTDATPAAKKWFLQWCAYPIQHPGTKLFTYVVLHGIKHGTGKSLIGSSLGRIYGKNYEEIKQRSLHESFNEWAEGKQFILGDDVTGSNKRQDNDILKTLITQEFIRINAKYMPSYKLRDCINYLFTSNQPDAFFLEDDDRRGFIHEVTVQPMAAEWYVDYVDWLKNRGGAEAIHYYLKHLNIEGFNPAGRALETDAKTRMILDVQSDLGGWVRQLIAEPDAFLVMGDKPLLHDIYTNKQLLAIYDPHHKTNVTANGLGRELRRAGVSQAAKGRTMRGPDGKVDRYYIIRNGKQWLRATTAAIHKHLETPMIKSSAPGKAKY